MPGAQPSPEGDKSLNLSKASISTGSSGDLGEQITEITPKVQKKVIAEYLTQIVTNGSARLKLVDSKSILARIKPDDKQAGLFNRLAKQTGALEARVTQVLAQEEQNARETARKKGKDLGVEAVFTKCDFSSQTQDREVIKLRVFNSKGILIETLYATRLNFTADAGSIFIAGGMPDADKHPNAKVQYLDSLYMMIKELAYGQSEVAK